MTSPSWGGMDLGYHPLKVRMIERRDLTWEGEGRDLAVPLKNIPFF